MPINALKLSLAALILFGLADRASFAQRQQEKGHSKRDAPKGQPASAPPVILPEPPTPVRQVGELGLTPCIGVVDKMARETLTSQYDVQSGWNRLAPSQHIFQSVAVLNRPQSSPPDGLAAIVAAPTPGGSCDGVAMQVFPIAGDCQSAQKVLIARGSGTTPILNARIMIDSGGRRVFLLPGFANTCIAVAVDSTFGEPGPSR
jgi:hypothetical protein